MKTLFKILGSIIFLGILLIAVSFVYSTTKGYTKWYLRTSGHVVIDGHKTSGYLHADYNRTILLLTRTDGSRPETYLVPLVYGVGVVDCGDWHPVRFLPTPVGDVNPPCSFFTDPATIVDPPMSRTLVRQERFIEFLTTSGKKVRAEW